jgi:YbgC/YbaW family acyl-CoA thioester hydrolase
MTNWSGYAHRVRFSEVDPQGIVFNSRYLEFFDAASIEFFRFFGYPPDLMQAAGLEPVLVEVNLRYHQSARLDQIIQIDITCSRLGKSSFDLDFEARIQDPESGLPEADLVTSANNLRQRRSSDEGISADPSRVP